VGGRERVSSEGVGGTAGRLALVDAAKGDRGRLSVKVRTHRTSTSSSSTPSPRLTPSEPRRLQRLRAAAHPHEATTTPTLIPDSSLVQLLILLFQVYYS
jgi:hypothetical protein